jgi:hypothetical protein
VEEEEAWWQGFGALAAGFGVYAKTHRTTTVSARACILILQGKNTRAPNLTGESPVRHEGLDPQKRSQPYSTIGLWLFPEQPATPGRSALCLRIIGAGTDPRSRKFPASKELTGSFRRFRDQLGLGHRKIAIPISSLRAIPYTSEQVIFLGFQGIKMGNQGKYRLIEKSISNGF